MRELIYKEDAIKTILGQYPEPHYPEWYAAQIKEMPSAQQEITDEQAIDHLQATGWMQEHDRQMYEMGIKEQLKDDSGSYDSLIPQDCIFRQAAIDAVEKHACNTQRILDAINALPSAQSEIIYCKDCKHWVPYDWMFSEVWRSINMDDYSEDEIGCTNCDMNMGANDFCSRAERKEK